MAWVRIDDDFPDHPKIVAAGSLAAWLYVTALCYCNRLLTDGFIPASQVDRLAPHRQDQDLRDSPGHLALKLCGLRLWSEAERKGVPGYVIHDYRKYQPTRKQVMAERRANAMRQGRFRENGRNGHSNAVTNTAVTPVPIPIPIPVPKEERKTSASLSLVVDPFLQEDITERAGAFVRAYEVLYPELRRGARYAVKPARDYASAVELCRTWVDDARLLQLARIFLTTDHKFAAEGSRTITQFLALASWCDGRLAEVEAGHL